MADPVEGRVVLGPFVRQLCQGLRGRDPDTNRNPDVPPHGGFHGPAQGQEFLGGAFDAEEGLVDAVDSVPLSGVLPEEQTFIDSDSENDQA
jgi:hypothetical protein